MTLLEGFAWVVLTVYHEARGEPAEGQRAVVKVILNRAHKKNWPVKNITLARKQFSCWNEGVVNNPKVWVKDAVVFASVAENCLQGLKEWQEGDKLQNATHYYAIKGMVNQHPPYWAEGMKFICEIEGHRFLREG